MRKTDKKLENQLREALTDVCDELLALEIGFQWLTHLVNFDRVDKSLKIILVFDTDANMQAFHNSDHEKQLLLTLSQRLKHLGIRLADSSKQVLYDSEEACLRTHNGKWNMRLTQH